MGWWSHDIMGGDSPLDAEDSIYEICGTEKFPKNFKFGEDQAVEVTAEALEANLPAILEMLKKDSYEPWIGYQVLGVMLMKSGAAISKELKETILQSVEDDEWGQEDAKRKEILVNFGKAITAYDGTPIVITPKGLFEVIANHLSEGKEGLVNL